MEELEPPRKTSLDTSIEGLKALVETLPGGSLGTFVLQQFIQLPLDKRMNEFYRGISEAINKHTKQISELSSNKRFITVLLQAGHIAVRNHQEQKLVDLRNAVINSIKKPTYDESMQTVFLSLIDRFTHWHIKVLHIFADPRIWAKNKPFGRPQTIDRFINMDPFFESKENF